MISNQKMLPEPKEEIIGIPEEKVIDQVEPEEVEEQVEVEETQPQQLPESDDESERLLLRLHTVVSSGLEKYELITNPEYLSNPRNRRKQKKEIRYFMELGYKRITISLTQLINGLVTAGFYTKEDFIYTDESLELKDVTYLDLKKKIMESSDEDSILEYFHALLITAESVIGSEQLGTEVEITEPSMSGVGQIEDEDEDDGEE